MQMSIKRSPTRTGKLRKLILLTISGLIIFAGWRCSDDDRNPLNPETIQFSRDILPVLVEYEGILRRANILPEGLQMDSRDNLLRGWERGEAVIPFDAENSLLIEMTTKLDNPAELQPEKLDLLARWIDEGAQDDDGEVAFSEAENLLYVCNQAAAKISVIDAATKVVIRTIDLTALSGGFSLASQPHFVAVEPDGSAWYVSLIGDNQVLKFNRENQFIGAVNINIPALLVAHPSNGRLYVSRFPQGPGGDQPLIGVIERATLALENDIVVQPTPHAMAVAGDGRFVYTCSVSGNVVVAIDAAANEADEPFVDLGENKGPIQVAVSPDNQTLAVSAQLSGEVFIIDVSDPANRRVTRTVAVAAAPWHLAFTPDGNSVYVANNGANRVSAIDVTTGAVTEIGDGTGTDGLAGPHGIAVTKEGDFVFVSSRNVLGAYQPRFDFGDNARVGTVVVISTASNTIEKVIEIEDFGSGMFLSQP